MRTRTAIASAITIAAVGFSAWTFLAAGPDGSGSGGIVARGATIPTDPSLQFTAGSVTIPARPGAVLGETVTLDTENLTDSLIGSYLSTMKAKNPSGPTDGKVSVPSGDTITSLIESAAQSGVTFTTFTERDVRVGTDPSAAAQRVYLESLERYFETHFGPTQTTFTDALAALMEKDDVAPLNALAEAVAAYTGEVLSLVVPPPLVSLHLDWLNLAEMKAEAYRAIARLSDDPLRSYATLQQLEAMNGTDARLRAEIASAYASLRP
jgi:hypothetical protein